MRKALLLIVTICLLLIQAADAATAFVQAKFGDGGSTTVATASATYTGANLIGCVVTWVDQVNTLTSVADATNGSYTLVNNNTNGAGGGRVANAYKENIAGFTGVITATFGGAALFSNIMCHEISGAATSSALDKSTAGGVNTAATTTDLVTITGVTTTTDGQYIMCATSNANGTGAAAGTGFSALRINNNGTTYELSEDMVQTSAGAQACKFTAASATSTNWQMGMMTFKATAAAATGTGGMGVVGVGN